MDTFLVNWLSANNWPLKVNALNQNRIDIFLLPYTQSNIYYGVYYKIIKFLFAQGDGVRPEVHLPSPWAWETGTVASRTRQEASWIQSQSQICGCTYQTPTNIGNIVVEAIWLWDNLTCKLPPLSVLLKWTLSGNMCIIVMKKMDRWRLFDVRILGTVKVLTRLSPIIVGPSST